MSIVGLLLIGLVVGLVIPAIFAFTPSANEKKDE
jgi:flagellar biosynthesis protein FliQ